MNKYLKIISLCAILLLLSSCNYTNKEQGNTSMKKEQTLLINNKNMDLKEPQKDDIFGKDFSQSVTGINISSGKLLGYFSQPKVIGDYPGIVIIHEWWGLNDQIKYMADLLANDGYKVFAIDLYDGEVATTQEKAMELATIVRNNSNEAIEKMGLAYDYLKSTQKVPKIASLGWCFGGGQSLSLSLAKKLDATIIYYGNLVTQPDKLTSISGPVLGIFGEKDTSITVDSVNKFQNALNKIGIKNEIHIYQGVGHAFANPTGNNYGKVQTKDAWEKTIVFLRNNLK